MRGAMCPFDCPFFLARLLWTRSARRAACWVAHCTASSRASSSDAGTPVVAGADAGASSTAVMMNSLRFADGPHTAALVLAFRRTDIGGRYTQGHTFLANPAAVVGQALGDPGPVQELQQRDRDPPGGPQR